LHNGRFGRIYLTVEPASAEDSVLVRCYAARGGSNNACFDAQIEWMSTRE
jgi:hypothetical protein